MLKQPAEESTYILRRKQIWKEINSGGAICATRSEKLESLGAATSEEICS